MTLFYRSARVEALLYGRSRLKQIYLSRGWKELKSPPAPLFGGESPESGAARAETWHLAGP